MWLPRETLLTFKEIVFLTDLFSEQGVDRIRITGWGAATTERFGVLDRDAPEEYPHSGYCHDHQWGVAC